MSLRARSAKQSIVDCHVALFRKQNYGLLGLLLFVLFEGVELPGLLGLLFCVSEVPGLFGFDFSVDSE